MTKNKKLDDNSENLKDSTEMFFCTGPEEDHFDEEEDDVSILDDEDYWNDDDDPTLDVTLDIKDGCYMLEDDGYFPYDN